MKILISGGGIAGLTLAFWLHRLGFKPVVIEKAPKLRTEGYMIDFFGSGWDVAERMGLSEELHKERYRLNFFTFVDQHGKAYFKIPIEKFRRACQGRYTYLLRGDLEKMLWEKVSGEVTIRYETTLDKITDSGDHLEATFHDGQREDFDLIVGADGVHSRVRELVMGPETNFGHYLGYYVAAFTVPNGYQLPPSVLIYQEPKRQIGLYPLNSHQLATAYLFKSENLGFIPPPERKNKLLKVFAGAGWKAEPVLKDLSGAEPIFFDSLTQIRLPRWHQGRVVLVGDACACLTLMAGQGASMAMAGAYVLAHELKKYWPDYPRAFTAYEDFLKPILSKKQRQAEKFANNFIPEQEWKIRFRRLFTRIAFWGPFSGVTARFFGAKSILGKYGSE